MRKTGIWEDDLLDRKSEGKFLVDYLCGRYHVDDQDSFVLNINAEWGFGKTYFLKNLAKELRAKNHPVVYFDAWQNDYTDNPLLAFISELNDSLSEYFKKDDEAKKYFKNAYQTAKNIFLPILVKKITGHGFDELNEIMHEDKDGETSEIVDKDTQKGVSSLMLKAAEVALSEHKAVKTSIETFKIQMEILTKHMNNEMEDKELPLFILVDELDRCRPTYAIELLENIKHIFDIPGLVFVVATDSKQLSHSINAIYGNDFASERYLKRFFSQEYNLSKPDIYTFSNYLFEINNLKDCQKLFSPLDEMIYNKDLNVEIFSLYASFFKLSLRDQEQVAIVLSAIVLTWQDDSKLIHLGYLLFLIMLKQKKDALFYMYNETKKIDFLTKEATNIDINLLKEYSTFVDTGNNSSKEKEVKLINLIELYVSLVDKNLEQLYKINSTSKTTKKIINSIKKELPQSYNNHYPLMYNFSIYPDLVLRAGQFL